MEKSGNQKWYVRIQGSDRDLSRLADAQKESDIYRIIRHERHGFLLTSGFFNVLNDYEKIYPNAIEATEKISGAMKLIFESEEPIMVNDLFSVDENGKEHTYIFLEDRFRIAEDLNVSVRHADGTITQIPTMEDIMVLCVLGLVSDEVGIVFQLMNQPMNDWSIPYKIYEVINKAVGGFVEQGWIEEREEKRFKHTANSTQASGIQARHGFSNTAPPKNPMSLSEGRNFIRGLALRWIQTIVAKRFGKN